MNKPDPLWVNGTCDRIMGVLLQWVMNYHRGKVSATGKYLTKPGEMGPQPQEIDVPTRHACEMAWRYADLEYLVKILEAKLPNEVITKDLRANLPRWKNGRITIGGARIVTIDMYFKDVVGIYQWMEAIRDGKTKESRPDLSSVDLSVFSEEARPRS